MSLCGTNLVYVVSFLMPNSSAINLSVSCRCCASICRTFWDSACRWPTRTWLILSRFLSFAKAFEPFVNTVSAHGFTSVHLHQHFMRLRFSFPQFVEELDVCTLLHCAVTLPLTLNTFNWPQLVCTAGHMQSMLCVDSPTVSEETCAKLPFI